MIFKKNMSLSEAAELIRGVSFQRGEGKSTTQTNHLPVIRAGNIQDELNLNEDLIWVPQKNISKKQQIKKNDLIMCTSSGSAEIVGKCARSECDWQGSFGAFCVGIRARQKICDAAYLFYYFRSPIFKNWSRKAGGANIKNIRKSELEEFNIPLPPLPEQKRISAILDKAGAIRRKRQQAIKLADEFLRATFLDMFGDPKAKNPKTQPVELGKIAHIVMGQSPKGDSYNTNGIGVPLLNGPAEFGIKYPKERQWTTEPKKYSKPGDILFCVRGATAGRLNLSDKEYCIGRGLAAIRPKGKISSEFIYKILEFMYQRFQESSDGSTFINISSNILNTLPVPDPSKTEEKQFTSIAKAIDILKNRNETSLKESETCFNSLTQRAFRGEL